ncbi:hypothetical protein [Kribbella sp. NPDC048915]|uniref:hypothetical protein n=1 Tax=Kribbella sp. NPDC048915 TaxID=3155148 RepID=UPI0033D5050F
MRVQELIASVRTLALSALAFAALSLSALAFAALSLSALAFARALAVTLALALACPLLGLLHTGPRLLRAWLGLLGARLGTWLRLLGARLGLLGTGLRLLCARLLLGTGLLPAGRLGTGRLGPGLLGPGSPRFGLGLLWVGLACLRARLVVRLDDGVVQADVVVERPTRELVLLAGGSLGGDGLVEVGDLLFDLLNAGLEQLPHFRLQAVGFLHQGDHPCLVRRDRLLQGGDPLRQLVRPLPRRIPRLNHPRPGLLPNLPNLPNLPGPTLEPPTRPEHLIHPPGRHRREIGAGQGRAPDGELYVAVRVLHVSRCQLERGLECLRAAALVASPARVPARDPAYRVPGLAQPWLPGRGAGRLDPVGRHVAEALRDALEVARPELRRDVLGGQALQVGRGQVGATDLLPDRWVHALDVSRRLRVRRLQGAAPAGPGPPSGVAPAEAAAFRARLAHRVS